MAKNEIMAKKVTITAIMTRIEPNMTANDINMAFSFD